MTYEAQKHIIIMFKKQPIWLLVVTYADVDWFSKLFQWQIPKESMYL